MRLFLALWPTEAERDATSAVQASVAWPMGAKVVARANLHLTLQFLGSVEADRLPALRQAVSAVHVDPFSLTLDCFSVWQGGIAVLEPSTLPQSLMDLHAALGNQLQATGFEIEARPFRPHTTLARRAVGAKKAAALAPVTWLANSYVLVESTCGSYQVRKAWPLLDKH